MICWQCHWGWPEQVAEIFERYCRLLVAESSLEFGPTHIVWSDHNFDDSSIAFCLNEIDTNREYYRDSIGDEELPSVRQSLVELKAIPESIRTYEPADYDGQHPEKYPPAIPCRHPDPFPVAETA